MIAAAAALARAALLAVVPMSAAYAAEPDAPRPASPIPNLFDPDHHATKPDFSAVKSIRFLTTDDFPPFHFSGPDGSLAGFDIDLARAICKDLKVACTMQARRFETLAGEIKAGRDDALMAAVANTPATRVDLLFTEPYYTTPARFVGALDAKPVPQAVIPGALDARTVGVVAGTAHDAYLRAFFPKARVKAYRNQLDLRAALQLREVDLIFADAIGLAIWLNGADARDCCAFRGGPFTESRYFGNGVSIAVAKDNAALRDVLDFELAKFAEDGTFADLYLKYFPIGFY